ncbi:MAG: hypothetical protein HZB38_02915 [Planctomycetes bacterium]|nr:hypothetical protein [Planctomycetota bacterium]
MKQSDVAKIVAAIGILAVAAFLVSRSFRSDPADEETTWRICGNADCRNEFSYTRAQARQAARENKEIACPKCGSTESAIAYVCEQCKRLTLAGVHASIPKACSHCKAPFPLPK